MHYYEYDPANRQLWKTYSNTVDNAGNKMLQATYIYYLHGPLKRVELATDLQGIDYTYTLQGGYVFKDDSLDFKLHKFDKGVGLIHQGSVLYIRNPILKGGESVLYNNDDVVGYITPNKFGIGTSFDYSIKFNGDDPDNYYLVLLFIIRLYSLEN